MGKTLIEAAAFTSLSHRGPHLRAVLKTFGKIECAGFLDDVADGRKLLISRDVRTALVKQTAQDFSKAENVRSRRARSLRRDVALCSHERAGFIRGRDQANIRELGLALH